MGVEEELLLFDAATREVASRSPAVVEEYGRLRSIRNAAGAAITDDGVGKELFRHQLETRTDPVASATRLLDDIVEGRRLAGEAAANVGLAAVASGIIPVQAGDPRVTHDDRYLAMVHLYGEVARTAGTCGMHVHVSVDSDDEGVAVIDRITPWLPVILAMSANSPFTEGRDTGHASWRAQQWARWPSAGTTERFESVASYREVCRRLIESGAAIDEGLLYFNARLSVAHPTVEVRVADVTDAADAVLIAVVLRALVESAARDWRDGRAAATWRAELLRAEYWRSARFGVAGTLVHPVDLRPARDVLTALVDLLGPILVETGDADLVRDGIERVLRGGGAVAQRAAYERSGTMEGVVDDLIARTENSWRA
jgi:carboxylate-amine ligase